MRLFVGIPLADEVRAQLESVVEQLRRGDDHLRWTAPQTWHVTLQFLGNVGGEQLECLKVRLAEVASLPVSVRLGTLGAFARAGIVHVEVEATAGLTELQTRVTAATAKCGFAPEERPFHPHITLARAGSRGSLRGVPAPRTGRENLPKFTPFEAREFLLYESFTERSGARYEARARYALSR